MQQPTNPAHDLGALRAEYDHQLAALRAEVAALRRHPRRHPRLLLAIVTVAMFVALVPLSLLAANPFTDLTGGVHDPNIDLIYNAGITTGCVPNVSYCPTDVVTREQMASFIARTAGLGTNLPVVNAKTAKTATLADTATTATTAGKLGTTPIGATAYAANEIARTAQALGTNRREPDTRLTVTKRANVDATYDPIATVAITAPSAGFIIVNGTVGLGIEGTGTAGFARLRDTAPGVAPALAPSPTLYTGGGSSLATTLSPSYVFPVAAGQRSFVLEVQKQGTGTVLAFDGVISAVFIPFGSVGTAQP